MITLVTSYVNFYRTPIVNHHYRLPFLQKIIDLQIPVVVFVSPDCLEAVEMFMRKLSSIQHVCIVPLAKSFFESSYMFITAIHSPNGPLVLPKHRFRPKDTLDYMCYQHSKVEYMQKVASMNPFKTSHFAWCDYDLFKQFECPPYLRFLCQHGLPYLTHKPPTEHSAATTWDAKHQLFFPGCWDKATYVMPFLCNNVCWRFCGGFFLGTKEAIDHFYDLYQQHYDKFLDTYNTMVWDVNFWTYLEQESDWDPYIYYADHNDSLIQNFPLFALASKPRPERTIAYTYPTVESFYPSSGSLVRFQNQYIYNVRYVNYYYRPDGHCDLQEDEKTCSVNQMVYLHDDYSVDSSRGFCAVEESPELMGLPAPDPDEQFQGIEDIRLYVHQNRLKFIATTVNYSGCATNRMVYGDYAIRNDANTDRRHVYLSNVSVIHPPVPSHKEKNWIPFSSITEPLKEYFIYSWFPFRMGIVVDNTLEITHFYNNGIAFPGVVRGSSNIVYDKGTYVALVHCSEEHTLPKRYFHMMIWMDATSYRPIRCSKLFYFDQYGPEFCLSLQVSREHYILWISRYDRDPITLYYRKDAI